MQWVGSYILLTLYATAKDIVQFCMRATPGPHDNGLAVRTGGDLPGYTVEKHVLHQVTALKLFFFKSGVHCVQYGLLLI